MTREEAIKKIQGHVEAVKKIMKEYSPEDMHLSICILNGYWNFNESTDKEEYFDVYRFDEDSKPTIKFRKGVKE